MKRVALVTGSSSGIGLAIAGRLAAQGVAILLHGLEPDGDELAAGLARRHDVPCLFDRSDLRNAAAAEGLVRRCERELGRLDVLVNNAGIQHVAPIDEFPKERWDAVLAVNLTAPFLLARAAWAGMRERRFGRVVNVASVHGLRASEFKAAYVAAKHGLVGLTKVLALEGAGVGITANAICPGFVHTPLVEQQIEDQARCHDLPRERVVSEVMLRKQPIKAFVPAEAIAEAAAFLASDLAATVTGSVLTLDGGWTCQ